LRRLKLAVSLQAACFLLESGSAGRRHEAHGEGSPEGADRAAAVRADIAAARRYKPGEQATPQSRELMRGNRSGGACIPFAERAFMSGSMLSSAPLDERRRRILFRAWRRGLREMDLVMGQFADANLAAMSEAELDEFERLLTAPDPQVLAWMTGEEKTPPEFDTALFARLRDAPRAALAKAQDAP
jgi:antitoxin CptB